MKEKKNDTLSDITLFRESDQSENTDTFTKLVIRASPGVDFDEAINQAIRDIPHNIIVRDIKFTIHNFVSTSGSKEFFYALIIYDVLNKE